MAYNIPGEGAEGLVWLREYHGLDGFEFVEETDLSGNERIISETPDHTISFDTEMNTIVFEWKHVSAKRPE